MKAGNILLLVLALILMLPGCSSGVSERALWLGGVPADTVFITGPHEQMVSFNTSEIVLEDGLIADGVLSDSYSEYGIEGFGDSGEPVSGYFLPLRILSPWIGKDARIRAVFMGQEADADILSSGGSYYAVVRLTGDRTLDYDGEVLSISVVSGNSIYSAELAIRQKQSIRESGLLLAPAIAQAGGK